MSEDQKLGYYMGITFLTLQVVREKKQQFTEEEKNLDGYMSHPSPCSKPVVGYTCAIHEKNSIRSSAYFPQ